MEVFSFTTGKILREATASEVAYFEAETRRTGLSFIFTEDLTLRDLDEVDDRVFIA